MVTPCLGLSARGTHTSILPELRVLGGESIGLRTEKEGEGRTPSNCLWKEVTSVAAVVLVGEGHSTYARASSLLKHACGTCLPH